MRDEGDELRDPVFIVGGRRSGSSLLYRTLQKHSAFRPRIEHLVESQFFMHLPEAHTWDGDPPHDIFDFLMFNRDELDRFLGATRRWRRIRSPLAPLHRRLVRRRIPVWWWRMSGGSAIAAAYFSAAHRARGAHRLLEKTPANFVHVDELLATFPSARTVYISRHPIDTFTSHLRRTHDDPTAGWAGIDADHFVRYWTNAARHVTRALDRHPDRFRLMRYESFTSDPVGEFRELCRYLGEPFEASCVEEREPDLDRHPADPHLFGEIVPTTKDWRSWVEETDAERIEHRLREPMRSLGYQPYTGT